MFLLKFFTGNKKINRLAASRCWRRDYVAKKRRQGRASGFTLIELLVVIAIIGLLSSITLASFKGAVNRAKDAAALSTGSQLARVIQMCDGDGGKVVAPNSSTDPTNDICSLGSSYGNWPQSPKGWTWYPYVWTIGENNLTYAYALNSRMYCGHYPGFSIYCGGVHIGLCRVADGFGCAMYNPSTGIWE